MYMTHKPYHLPQLSAPYNIIVDGLRNSGIDVEEKYIDPEKLTPTQGIVYSNEFIVDDETKINPIYVCGMDDNENNIVDGHNRWVYFLSKGKPMKIIKLKRTLEDSIRLLNKIEDIYEYNNYLSNENINNDKLESENLLDIISNENNEICCDGNKKSLYGYRNTPIIENSECGNFFMLKPIDGYEKYAIELENVFDTDEAGLVFLDGQNPIEMLCNLWFPTTNFISISEKIGIDVKKLMNRAITEMAKKHGFDGIKYGDKIIQGF